MRRGDERGGSEVRWSEGRWREMRGAERGNWEGKVRCVAQGMERQVKGSEAKLDPGLK